MVVEKMNIGNVKVTIHDDYVVSDEKKLDAILKQIGVLAYNQFKSEAEKNKERKKRQC